MYGRVPPSAADGPRGRRRTRARCSAAVFRGRIGIPPAAQAAIGFAHEHLALPRCRDLSYVSTPPVDGGAVRVRIDSPQGSFDVTVGGRASTPSGSPAPRPGPSWFVAHRPLAIEPAAG